MDRTKKGPAELVSWGEATGPASSGLRGDFDGKIGNDGNGIMQIITGSERTKLRVMGVA